MSLFVLAIFSDSFNSNIKSQPWISGRPWKNLSGFNHVNGGRMESNSVSYVPHDGDCKRAQDGQTHLRLSKSSFPLSFLEEWTWMLALEKLHRYRSFGSSSSFASSETGFGFLPVQLVSVRFGSRSAALAPTHQTVSHKTRCLFLLEAPRELSVPLWGESQGNGKCQQKNSREASLSRKGGRGWTRWVAVPRWPSSSGRSPTWWRSPSSRTRLSSVGRSASSFGT